MNRFVKVESFIKRVFWPGLHVVIKTLTAGLINKFFATILGPIGFGAFGNYLNLFQILFNPSSTALNNSVLAMSDRQNQTVDKKSVAKVFWLAVVLNIGSVAAYLLTQPLWARFEVETSLSWIFVLMLACFLQPTMAMLNAVLNGTGKTAKLVSFSSVYSILSAATTFLLLKQYGFIGALWSLTANAFFAFTLGALGLFGLRLRDLMQFGTFFKGQKKFFVFLLMSVVSAVVAPLVQMTLRQIIGNTLGSESVGLWQGMQRVSELYMSVVISVISFTYLPELASAQTREDLKTAFSQGLRTVAPVGALVVLFAVLASEFVLKTLLSETFVVVSGQAKIYFSADIFRTFAFLGSYYFLGRAHFRLFVVSEVFAGMTQVVLYYAMIQKYGFDGVAYAQVLNAILYSLFCFGLVIALLNRNQTR